MIWLGIYLGITIIFGMIGVIIAKKKGRDELPAFLVGFIFGIIGLFFLCIYYNLTEYKRPKRKK